MAPVLSLYAQQKKIRYFIDSIPKDARVLEVGCGSRWVGEYMRTQGWRYYQGIDLQPPADIVGDIKQWRELGLQAHSFDYIIAFEVVEHVHIFDECYELLSDDGVLLLTTPVPHMDWILKILETLGLNQKRTSPHSHLLYLRTVENFSPIELRTIAFLSQWGKLKKRLPARA